MADPALIGEQNGSQLQDIPNQTTTDNEATSPTKPGESIFASKSKDDPAKLFVGGLNACTTNESLLEHFSQFGEVLDVNVKYSQDRMGNLRDPNEQMRSRGFGFVLFKNPDTAKLVLRKDQQHLVDGKEIEVKKAVRQGQPRSKKLFVGGIKDYISDEILNAYFSAFGAIVEIKIILNHETKRRRGFAFIQFEDESTVDTIAMVKFHDLTNGPDKCRVEVKPVLPQSDKPGQGSFRGRGGFRGGDGRWGGFGRGGYGHQQGGGYQGDGGGYQGDGCGYQGDGGGYQGDGGYNQYAYNQGGRGTYNQEGYQQSGNYYQQGYDQQGYNQQYDQQYQGYNCNYGQNYGQNQDGSGGNYANGSGYQAGYQTGYDASSYGGQQQYNYGTNYGQEASNYGKVQGGGYQHTANQPY